MRALTAGQELGTAPSAPVALVPRSDLCDMSLTHLESPVSGSQVFMEIAFVFEVVNIAFQNILALAASSLEPPHQTLVTH